MAMYLFLTIKYSQEKYVYLNHSLISHFIMATRRVWLRKRVVQFVQDHRGMRDDRKSFTVKHFEAEGVFRSTTYNIINNYFHKGNVDHKKGVDDLLMLWHLTMNNDYGRQSITKLGYHREIWRVDLTVLKRIYISKCLRPNLLPFLARKTNHIFWPDLASAHYSTKTLEFLNTSNANLVPKAINPPNVPQCRPIEDFFWALATKVYAWNWVAKDTPALVARIRRCVRVSVASCTRHDDDDTDKVTKHIHAWNLQFMPLIYS